MTRLPQLSTQREKAYAGRWFDGGVRFRCLGPECGECCSGKHGPGAVWLGREDTERLAAHLSLTLKEFRRSYTRRLRSRTSLRERANFDCIFYRPDVGCSVYEARPLQCRTYPFWSRILASRVTWDNEAEQCPGIGGDDRVSGEEIKRQLELDSRRKP